MYAETILEHYKHPHNYGQMPKASVEHRESNPLCGDIITIYLLVEKEKVKDVKFVGKGCAISQAATSLLTDEIKGKSIEEIRKMDKDFALDLLGVDISAARMKCALLGIKTLKLTIYDYLVKQKGRADEKDFEVEDA